MHALKHRVLLLVKRRHHAARGREHVASTAHRRHRIEHAREMARSHRAQDGRPQEHGLGLLGQRDAAAGHVGVLSQEHRVLAVAAAGDQGVDAVAMGVHRVEDVPRAVGDGLNRCQVEQRQRIHAVGQLEPADHAAQRGIGPGRAVAVVIGQHVQLPRQLCGERAARRQRLQACVEQRVHAGSLPARLGGELGAARMAVHHVIDQRAGRALPALGQPEPRDHRRVVRTPDPRDELRLAAHRHVTARRAADQRDAPLERFGVRRQPVERDAEQPQPAGVGVDDGHADRGARGEPELFRRRGAEPADALAHRSHARSDPGPAFVSQRAETDLAEIVRAEAAFVAQVRPLADRGAERAHVLTRRAPRQEIGKIEEPPRTLPRRCVALAEPQQLGRLHLGRDHPAHVAQHLVAKGVDARSLLGGAVVHPHDDVLDVLPGRAHAHRPPPRVERHQRTRGVEADPRHPLGREPGLVQGMLHRHAHRAPDVVGRLLDEVLFGTEDLDGLDAHAEPGSRAVEQPGSHAARPHVHPQNHAFGHDAGMLRGPSGVTRADLAKRVGDRRGRVSSSGCAPSPSQRSA